MKKKIFNLISILLIVTSFISVIIMNFDRLKYTENYNITIEKINGDNAEIKYNENGTFIRKTILLDEIKQQNNINGKITEDSTNLIYSDSNWDLMAIQHIVILCIFAIFFTMLICLFFFKAIPQVLGYESFI